METTTFPVSLLLFFCILGMIISMPFLLLTFLVFAMVPNASIHRKVLMFYSLSLLLAYAFLVTVQLNKQYIEPLPCHTIGKHKKTDVADKIKNSNIQRHNRL